MIRAVVDTNVLVSGLLRRQGTAGALFLALRDERFKIIYSAAMLVEIIDVLSRPFFRQKYHLQTADITALIDLIRLRGELVNPTLSIAACRDPRDNKFLEGALAGQAEWIVTGDDDLLALHPFEGVSICRPGEFLGRL